MKLGIRDRMVYGLAAVLWGRKRKKKLLRLSNWVYFLETKTARNCPICGYSGLFRDVPPRQPDGKCPRCGSLERHRLLYLYLTQPENRLAGRDVLHFAPEECIRSLGAAAKRYVTADLVADGVDRLIDITRIEFPDSEFDVILCNHVLEHVPDDSTALAELYRILRPGGQAVLTVPIVDGWSSTYEDPGITSEALRRIHFGQDDHVRAYGRDFRERIAAAGFEVQVFQAAFPDYARYALMPGDTVYIGEKSTRSAATQ